MRGIDEASFCAVGAQKVNVATGAVALGAALRNLRRIILVPVVERFSRDVVVRRVGPLLFERDYRNDWLSAHFWLGTRLCFGADRGVCTCLTLRTVNLSNFWLGRRWSCILAASNQQYQNH